MKFDGFRGFSQAGHGPDPKKHVLETRFPPAGFDFARFFAFCFVFLLFMFPCPIFAPLQKHVLVRAGYAR